MLRPGAFDSFIARQRAIERQTTSTRKPIKMKTYSQAVLEGVLTKRLEEVSSALGVDRRSVGSLTKKWFGKSFSELQSEARLAYIEQHYKETDAVLAKKLNVQTDTINYFVSELKKAGRIPNIHRQTGRNYSSLNKLPLQRNSAAFEVANVLGWISAGGGLSSVELSSATARQMQGVHRIMTDLAKHKFVKKTGKTGNAFFYQLTPEGYSWLRKMNEIVRAREERARKNPSEISRLIKKRQHFKEMFIELRTFMIKNGEEPRTAFIANVLSTLSTEIAELNRMKARFHLK